MAHTEYEEARAMRMISRGQGLWPLRADGHANYDEAYVTFDLEEPDLVMVYLRKNGEAQAMYSFRLTPHAHLLTVDVDEEDENEPEPADGACDCCGGPLDPPPDAHSDSFGDIDWGPNDFDAGAGPGAQGELGF